jgi:hypothetical protein
MNINAGYYICYYIMIGYMTPQLCIQMTQTQYTYSHQYVEARGTIGINIINFNVELLKCTI